MDNRERKLKRLKLLRDSGQSKEHFKMYKVRKNWIFAGITVLFFGTGVFFGHPEAYADSTAETPTTEIASDKTSSASSKSESVASSSNAISDAASTASEAATSADTTASETPSSQQKESSASSTSQTLASASSSVAASSASAASLTASSQATSSASSSADSATDKTNQSSANQTSIPQIKTQSAEEKTSQLRDLQVTESAIPAVSVDTGTLNGKNPADYDENGNYTGNSATSTLTGDEVSTHFDTTGSAVVTGEGVTLINGSGQNGSYVFDNQVDTNKGFSVEGKFTSSAKDHGGGYGIILQPVDPKKAGVNNTSSTLDGSSTYAVGQADVGIEGLPNTTFIGRDFYQSQTSGVILKGDTTWNAITVRQTDVNGNMITTNVSSTTAGSHQTNAIKYGEYYTLTWTPNADQSTTVKGYVSGTFIFTTYLDEAKTKQVQTLTSQNVVISQAVSLAAFAASGGLDATDTTNVTSFSGTRVTMPVTVHYVDQTGKSIASDDTITVNVGSKFGCAAEC